MSETLQRVNPEDFADPPATPVGRKDAIFGTLKPWVRTSPEEVHLRNYVGYLGSRLWLIANLIYGAGRHLLPFASAIYALSFVLGTSLSPWLGPMLHVNPETCGKMCPSPDLVPCLWLGGGLLLLAGMILAIRNTGQTIGYQDAPMFLLQYLGIFTIYLAIVVLAVLVALPWLLIRIHSGALDFLRPLKGGISLTTVTSLLSFAISWIAKHRTSKWFSVAVSALTALTAPIVILVPLVGFAYWNARSGAAWSANPQRLWIAIASLAYLLAMWLFVDEVTSVAHLFYRERLATAFVGYRRMDPCDPDDAQRYVQPPWDEALNFSELVKGEDAAKLPNLVVCAAANLSGGTIPAGRLAVSFTFERDRVGGPTTGYVTTPWMEKHAGDGVVTLPALMAISGAAVAPSMGKMTIPALRFLMAVFDMRLGTWLPNPATSPWRDPPSLARPDFGAYGPGCRGAPVREEVASARRVLRLPRSLSVSTASSSRSST